MLPIKDYAGDYWITKKGQVYSTIKNKFMATNKHRGGYLTVMLYKNKIGKRFYIHRLVAQTYKSNSDDSLQVNHIDFNRANNCVDNLEWVTVLDNIGHSVKAGRRVVKGAIGERNTKAKVDSSAVYQIRRLCEQKVYSTVQLADIFDIHKSGINNIASKRTWKHLP